MKLAGVDEGDVEQNKKALCARRLSKKCICIISGTYMGIKLKLWGPVEGNVELNQKTLNVSRL